jgi:hypothetical protein
MQINSDFDKLRQLLSHVIASRFLATAKRTRGVSNLPFLRRNWLLGDCFVPKGDAIAKNAPRHERHNGFDRAKSISSV